MRFPTMWFVRPAKVKTSLRICAVSKVKRGPHRLVWVYSCQKAALLEITCCGSYIWLRNNILKLESSLWSHIIFTWTDTVGHVYITKQFDLSFTPRFLMICSKYRKINSILYTTSYNIIRKDVKTNFKPDKIIYLVLILLSSFCQWSVWFTALIVFCGLKLIDRFHIS